MSKTQLSTPRSSWLTGAGSVWNLFGSYYGPYKALLLEEAREADRKALASDWEMVGQDFNHALSELSKELTPQQRSELAKIIASEKRSAYGNQ